MYYKILYNYSFLIFILFSTAKILRINLEQRRIGVKIALFAAKYVLYHNPVICSNRFI